MEFRPYYFAREWVRAGHRVLIVAGTYSHIRSRQPYELHAYNAVESIDGVTYRWYRTPSYQGNGMGRVRSMLTFISCLWRDARQIARDFKPDLVIASSTYPMDIWPARRIARMAQAKLVYEVHDLWPLSPIELGGMSKWHPFIMWVQRAEDYAYRHADKVVSLLPKALEYMQSRGLASRKFIYVPNGVNEAEWYEPEPLSREVTTCLAQMRVKGLPIVAYVGTHGLANALDTLLDAAHLLKGKVQILMVGPGPERDRLLARVRSEGLLNVVMLQAIPKRAVPCLLKQVDIAYIGWHPNPLYRFGIAPNKLLDYMMAGKPVVHAVNAGNDLVAEAECGLTVPPGDPSVIAQAILQLAQRSPQELAAIGAKGKLFILKNQTYTVLAKRFLDGVEDHLDPSEPYAL